MQAPVAGTPQAEFAIDATLVRRLLAAQHPDLAALPMVAVAAGWDNAIFRLGTDLAVRLPRREAAAGLVLNEQRWLGTLAPRLPIPVPVPTRLGVPDGGYPWCWSITPWFEGTTADLAPVGAEPGLALATFLRALHVPAPADAPRNPYRGVPLAVRVPVFERRRANLAERGETLDARVESIWVAALAADPDHDTTWIHGDLHPRNVLVRDGRFAAILDWGDVACGDRATDLAAIWMLLGRSALRHEAMRALVDVSPSTWRRARGWAVLQSLILLDAGLVDDPRMAAIGRLTLARLLEDADTPDG